jgi:hypothetical protein
VQVLRPSLLTYCCELGGHVLLSPMGGVGGGRWNGTHMYPFVQSLEVEQVCTSAGHVSSAQNVMHASPVSPPTFVWSP